MDLQQLLDAGVLQPGALQDFIINEVPATSTRIADMGLFQSSGMLTDVWELGMTEQTNTLVPAVPRGSPSQPKSLKPGKIKHFKAVHLPQRSTVLADELLYLRGRMQTLEGFTGGVQGKINALEAVHKRDIDYTIEHHRMGAIKGKVLDSDGSEILDIYAEFGVSQITMPFALGTTTTKVRTNVLQLKQNIEDELKGAQSQRVHVFCSPEFFYKLIEHPNVEKLYERFEAGAALRDDLRGGFVFGNTGVTFEMVSGSVGGQRIIAQNEAVAFPVGVPDMFITKYAPADTLSAIGAETQPLGLPYYANVYPLQHDKGLELITQSNPLNINTRPRAVIRLTTN